MSAVVFKPGTVEGFDRLEELLTSPDDRERCLGRAFASDVGPAVEKWLNAEFTRGTDRVLLLNVLADLGLQHIANLAAVSVQPSGDAAVVELVQHLTQDRLGRMIAATRAAEAKGGAA